MRFCTIFLLSVVIAARKISSEVVLSHILGRLKYSLDRARTAASVLHGVEETSVVL